jgi:hypothetical protein
MLNPEDDISAGAVALPRRNIFADPDTTSTRGLQPAHGVFDQAAGEGASRLTDQDEGAWAARATAWRRCVPGVARLVLAAVVVGAVVAFLSARGPHDAVPLAPKRPPARAMPAQGDRARPLNKPTRAARKARPRSLRSKTGRRRPKPALTHRRRTVPSRRVAPASPTPAPLPPRVTPKAPQLPEEPAPVPASSPPEFM